MKPTFLFLLTALLAVPSVRADWPQWRGPFRNGIASDDAKLPDQLSEETPPTQVWKSTEIPSDHYGGHGSVSVANGKVYLSVVWHRDQPTETRRIDRDVMSDLGYRGTNSLGPELVAKMESDRMNLSRRLRGTALDEWAEKWVDDNIDEKTKLSLGSWIASRFKKGQAAIPISVYEQLETVNKREFANQAEMEAWVDEQNFEPSIRDQIIAAVPATKKVADDVILCLDAATGEEVWRFSTEGHPSGRGSSSTPAVADGKVYGALSTNLYCVNAETGEEVWRTPMEGRKGPASSPLVHGEKVFLQENYLSAFDATTGEHIWKNADVKGANPSPAIWRDVVVCNSAKELVGVDSETGKTLWATPGGGDGTPVVNGNSVVITSNLEGKNIIAFTLYDGGAAEEWSTEFLARRYGASPIIHDGNVYHLGSERHLCLDLKTGETKWERQASSSISSPLFADGKLLVYENRGGFAILIDANPEEYRPLGRAKVGALYCASPALVGSDLFLRTKDSVACYRFE